LKHGVNTIDYLFGSFASVFWPGVIASLLIAVAAGLLSPLVVLRRLSFVGQGVSHAGFAGLGMALVITLLTNGALHGPLLTTGSLVVLSLGAGWLIASVSGSGREQGDTAIGVVMVTSMALGFVLTRLCAEPVTRLTGRRPPDLESVLFGSVVSVGWTDAIIAAGVCLLVVLVVWMHRRSILFWAMDEEGAASFGVRTDRTRLLVLMLLSLLVVLAVRVAGVVLATAVLVLPGAAALRLSSRLSPVLVWSVALSLASVVGGSVLAYEADLPPGPAFVLVGAALWAGSLCVRRV
jgi:zinc transport system permease protein